MKNHLLIALTALLLVAASPQLLVEITYDNTNPQITDYERTTGPDPTRMSGSWTLELLDEQGTPVAQTRFDPTLTLPDGTQQPQEQTHVLIQAPAAARSISLLDEQANRVAALELRSYCGDGRCDAEEIGNCPQDCHPEITEHEQEIEQARSESPQDPAGLGIGAISGIAGASILIVILVLVLLHLNRKKPNPVQLD